MRSFFPVPTPAEAPIHFGPLLIVVALAFGVPILLSRFRRLRVPIVVGEILGGILVGRSGLGWVAPDEPALRLLSEIGFVFLMFMAGMEIDFSLLRGGSPRASAEPHPLSLAIRHFLLTLLASAAISWGLYLKGLIAEPWLMSLILSTTSLGVVVPVLKEQRLSGTLFGQALLLAALVADFATMLLITVNVALISTGLTLEILLIGLLFVFMLLVYAFGDFLFNRIPGVRALLEELSHATAQIKVRLAFLVLLVFVVLAETLGAEIILGAFLAGLIVSLLRGPEDEALVHQLESMGFGFFIPIFFVMVGVEFNLSALAENRSALILLPLLLIAAVVVKGLPSVLYRRPFGGREALAAGALLSARLSLIIAASEIGLRVGVISEAVNAAIILVALTTVTIAPSAFLALLPRRREATPPPVVVVGAGELGLQVSQMLQEHGERVLIVDRDPSRLERARRLGLEAAPFPPPDDAPLDGVRTLVCTHSDPDQALEVCRWARGRRGIEHVVALVTDPAREARFTQLGVTPLVAGLGQAHMLALMARNPDVVALLTRTDDARVVREVVLNDPALDGKPLREARLPGDVLVLSLHRDGDLMIPHGDTRLRRGDRLTVAGSQEHVDAFRDAQERR